MLTLSTSSAAQRVGPRALAPTPRCEVVRRGLDVAAFEGLSGESELWLEADPVGAFLAWRDTEPGTLRLRRLNDEALPVGETRVLGRAVSRFVMSPTPSGVAVAAVERGREVLVSRVSVANEGQNVPRVVATVPEGVASLSMVPGSTGLSLVWSALDTRAMTGLGLDSRGVPRGPGVPLGSGDAVRLVRLATADATLLFYNESPTQTMVATLGSGLALTSHVRWPLGAAGPVEMGGAVYSVQPLLNGHLVLYRMLPGAVVPVTMPDISLAVGMRPVRAVGAGPVVLAEAREGNNSAVLVRLFSDGSSSTLGSVRPWPLGQPLSIEARGSGWMVTREVGARGSLRLGVLRVRCEGT